LHLARVLDEMRSFYRGEARAIVDLLLARWDLHNLITLMRGQASQAPVEDVLGAIVPLGGFDEPAAREIARQREFAATVSLLEAWRLPTRDDARTLAAAWPEYERTHDLASLELELAIGHFARLIARLEALGGTAAPVRQTVAREVDARNVLAALRLREATVAGELGARAPDALRRALLPGGALRDATLLGMAQAPATADALTALLRDPAGRPWREPLRRWAESGDLVALHDALEATVIAAALGLFSRGDPLGADIPVAFAAAKELEARNLRVLGDAAARRVDPLLTRGRLVAA